MNIAKKSEGRDIDIFIFLLGVRGNNPINCSFENFVNINNTSKYVTTQLEEEPNLPQSSFNLNITPKDTSG